MEILVLSDCCSCSLQHTSYQEKRKMWESDAEIFNNLDTHSYNRQSRKIFKPFLSTPTPAPCLLSTMTGLHVTAVTFWSRSCCHSH